MNITELETTIHNLTVERDALKEQLECTKGNQPVSELLEADAGAEEVLSQLRHDLACANSAIADLHKEISDRDAVTANDKALIQDLQNQILALKQEPPEPPLESASTEE